MTATVEITIHHNDDFLGYVTALQRIQAIQLEHITQQIEEYGRARDDMSEAKAYADMEGERP